MIFEEIVLHNFGIYQGKHTVNLDPKSKTTPVVLFGALNGGGKTTFLDALQLSLYGKFAKCSNRGNLSYPEFLKRTINRHVSETDGASVELQFRHRRDGQEDIIRINRRWQSTGKMIKETVDVLRNGEKDDVLAERWYEFVDEFIPAQISNLFFFDGEKIEALAAPEKAAEIIQTGLHALLGLDLVDRLSKDLKAVSNRRKTLDKDDKQQEVIAKLEMDLMDLNEQRKDTSEQLAQKKTQLQTLTNKLESLQVKFRNEGGEIFEQREKIALERKTIVTEINSIENQLREIASADAPLLIIQDLLKQTHESTLNEFTSRQFADLKDLVESRDIEILKGLESKGVDKTSLHVIEDAFKKDLEERSQHQNEPLVVNTYPSVFTGIDEAHFAQIKSEINSKLNLLDNANESLSNIDRTIAAIPDPETLEGINAEIEKISHEINLNHAGIEVLEKDLKRLDMLVEQADNKYHSALEEKTRREFEDDASKRILTHSDKLQKTFSEFKKRVALKHISQLENLILESFQQLIRKPELIGKVSISTDTFNLTLYSPSGEIVTTERLSAGERQLLAVSVLWGLAKASGRPLPVVIDTPLGRLDGIHRSNLVENYFPFASHQVLLLSTDQEIDKKHQDALKKSIGHEYQIAFNEDLKTSTIQPGYFW